MAASQRTGQHAGLKATVQPTGPLSDLTHGPAHGCAPVNAAGLAIFPGIAYLWSMDLREALPIIFCSTPKAKVMAYLLTLILITLFAGGLAGFVFLLIPLGLDAYGGFLVKDNHKAFQEDVLENLEAECLRACGIDKTLPNYPFIEIGGAIDHWMLKDFKAWATCTMMAPKDDFVVIASRKGRIFPLKTYFPVRYHTEDTGTRDVYYSDISAVELSGKVLSMTTAAGEVVAYTGQGDKAAQAAEHIRNRLREYKSRRVVA